MKTNTLFVERAEKSWKYDRFARSLFMQDVKWKRNVIEDIQVVRIAENLRAKRQNFMKDSDAKMVLLIA